MIKISKDTPLTIKNLSLWFQVWEQDRSRLEELWRLFTNKKNKKNYLKMPFAKKLVTISAAAAAGDGVTLSATDKLDERQKSIFDEVQRLFKKQTIIAHDREIIKQGCIFSRGYELVYMSGDEKPVPKVAKIPATNAFVVYDDTVEKNSLYGVYFEEYNEKGTDCINIFVYDRQNYYSLSASKASFLSGGGSLNLGEGQAHHMGRMPLTEYTNNDEEQSDFEQIIDLMKDRTAIHNLNLQDMKDLAKNYLKGRNVKLAGKTPEEKTESRKKATELKLIEVSTTNDGFNTQDNPNDDITILSKNENYSSIDIFGKDIDSKIYDLALIPNLADEQFAGNQSGVALELKLMPFKELVKAKDVYIERLYRRRLKMYVHAITGGSTQFVAFDAGDIEITINRSWTENTAELAAMIMQLQSTGLFSDEFLVNMLPTAEYTTEQERKANEQEQKSKASLQNSDSMNSGVEDFAALFRGIGNGSTSAS